MKRSFLSAALAAAVAGAAQAQQPASFDQGVSVKPLVASFSQGCGWRTLCEGDTVRLSAWNKDYVGRVSFVSADGRVKVDFYADGSSYSGWRNANEVSKEVSSIGGIGRGTKVRLTSWNQNYIGTVQNVFADGMAKIEFYSDGTSYTGWREIRDIAAEVGTYGRISRGNAVHLTAWNQDYSGTASNVFADGRVKVDFYSDGTSYTGWREEREIAKEVGGYGGVFKGRRVHLIAWNNDYIGTAENIYEDGMVKISFYSDGTSYTAWRRIGNVASEQYCVGAD